MSAAVTLPFLARASLTYRIPLDKPPDVLAERARQMLTTSGHTEDRIDWAYGFVVNNGLFAYLAQHDPSGDRLPPEAIAFWYRQSASAPLLRRNFLAIEEGGAGVSYLDPPLQSRGDALVWLDPDGRLLVVTLLRFGLVGVVVGVFIIGITVQIPFAPSMSAWYARTALVSQAVLLVPVVVAFVISLGGRPMFGGATLEDA